MVALHEVAKLVALLEFCLNVAAGRSSIGFWVVKAPEQAQNEEGLFDHDIVRYLRNLIADCRDGSSDPLLNGLLGECSEQANLLLRTLELHSLNGIGPKWDDVLNKIGESSGSNSLVACNQVLLNHSAELKRWLIESFTLVHIST